MFGRSRRCDWVLPDPDRHLSSVHARVLYQNDTFVLVDESTNGTFLESQSAPIGRGKAVSLSTGMRLRAGPYELRVESLQNSQTPHSDVFSAHPPAASSRTSVPTPLRIDTLGASMPKTTSLDPLDHLGGQPETLTPVASARNAQSLIPEPVAFSAQPMPASPHETTRFQPAAVAASAASAQAFGAAAQGAPQATGLPYPPGGTQHPAPGQPHGAMPLQPAPAALQPGFVTPPPAGSTAASAANIIPEDFLTGFTAAPVPVAAPLAAPMAALGAIPPSPQGLPDLTSMLPAQAAHRPAQPAVQASAAPASTPASAGTIPEGVDFGFGLPGSPATPAQPAGQPAAQLPIQPPVQTASPAAMPSPLLTSPPTEARPQATSASAPLNPLEALKKRREQREAELAQKAKSRSDFSAAKAPKAPAAPAKPMPSSPLPVVTPAAITAPGPSTASAATPPAATTAAPLSSGEQEVFQALLAGLGFANADVPKENQAEVARATGEMVRELANGLIALLKARKSLKNEFRMYETRIQPEENNPFKHFDIGELAIDEMLFARKGGFLAPPDAAREAFKDLQSHTMRTVAATQRAMRILFESLSPETLAGEEDDGGLRLKGLGTRRGKWDTAKEKHDRLRADFDAVVRQTIAEAFVQVEEEQARQQSKSFWETRKK
ncbi:type VI secretion system-associated FHA domain protein TagH [Roseibium sp. M-1]